MADLKIIGNGEDAQYVLEYDNEEEFVELAKTLGKTCYHCRDKRIQHTDRADGTPHFCCGDRHAECPVCYLCESCGCEASYTCDDCGDWYCDGCHDGAHDDPDPDDEPDDEPEPDTDDDDRTIPVDVPEPEVIEAREDEATFDDKAYVDWVALRGTE